MTRLFRMLCLLTFAAALASFAGCAADGSFDVKSAFNRLPSDDDKDSGTRLTRDDLSVVLRQAIAAAEKMPSLLRVNGAGEKQTTRMHIYVVDRAGRVVGYKGMDDAWAGSVAIAKAKAYTAVAFSSDQNALTSRSLGALSQPSGPLWNIGNTNTNPGLIEFPGGVPLYKGGKLVGAIGVSGDGVEEDEAVAAAGAKGFEAPKAIRIDTLTDGAIPYTK